MAASSPTLEFEHHVRMTESERLEISQHDDGWSGECLVCHAWISTRNGTCYWSQEGRNCPTLIRPVTF